MNEFLNILYLDMRSLENEPWTAYHKYIMYQSSDKQQTQLDPLIPISPTIIKLYQQTLGFEVNPLLKLK